jgi:hypothetical protein
MMKHATVHARHHQVPALFVVQIDACLYAAEKLGDFIDNAVDQLVEIENRRDPLSGLLHTLKVFHQIGGQGPCWKFAADDVRERRHLTSACESSLGGDKQSLKQ